MECLRYQRYLLVRRNKLGFILSCLLAFMSFTSPLEAGQENSITLDDAISLALKQNPELTATRKSLDIARGELLQARIYPFNPELSIGSGFGKGRTFENEESRSTSSVQIDLSQTVELKGQWSLRIRRSMANREQVDWSIRDMERRVIGIVTQSFNDMLISEERLRFADEIIVLNQELLRISKELLDAGAVPRLDLLRAEVELRRAVNQQTVELRRLEATERDLSLLLGLPQGSDIDVTGPLLYSPREIDLNSLMRLAFESRQDLKGAEAGVRVAEAELAIVQAERIFPEMNASLRYEEDREVDSRDRRGVIEISIPLPFINRRQGEMASASAERERQMATVDLVRARIEKEVRQAFDRFILSRKIVETFSQRILPGLEENLKLIREGYEMGENRITDVLLVQKEFIETRLSYIDAVADLNTAVADLEGAVGSRLIETEQRP